jgi:PAS domain-containing protein
MAVRSRHTTTRDKGLTSDAVGVQQTSMGRPPKAATTRTIPERTWGVQHLLILYAPIDMRYPGERSFGVVEDLSRESEARIQVILETAIDGIITIDERGIVESAKPAVQ